MTSPSDLDQARYAAMRWNTPLSVDHAALLVDRLGLELGPGVDVLDLGCGWGELLMRAVEAGGSGATGVGIDNDEHVLGAWVEKGQQADGGFAVLWLTGFGT